MKSYRLLGLIMMISGCSNAVPDNSYSMYYKDTLNVSSYVGKCDSLWVRNSAYEVSDNSLVFLKNPDQIKKSDLHYRVYYIKGMEQDSISVSTRCWKENRYSLSEIKKPNGITFFMNRVKMRCQRQFGDSLSFARKFYRPILLTKDGLTYYVEKGKLYSVDINRRKRYLSDLVIQHPTYNQLVVEGKFGILRTGHDIMVSSDSLRNWKRIYHGPGAIRESIKFSAIDSTIIFTQYTPGTVRNRHYVLRYKYSSDQIDTLKTFFTEKEFLEQGRTPCARHIHILSIDPYTGWLFLGTGDTDLESAIYVSKDGGLSFELVGGGKQTWRTLSFLYFKDAIVWNTDSHKPQYLSKVYRKDLEKLPVPESYIEQYPLINSALWCTIPYGDMILMSSNVEGALYDNCRRIFGIKSTDNKDLEIFSLWQEPGNTWSSQLFPVGIDIWGNIQYYDTENKLYRTFKLEE